MSSCDIYSLSLHDALPISSNEAPRGPSSSRGGLPRSPPRPGQRGEECHRLRVSAPSGSRRTGEGDEDRKSTRLNSSHLGISYAVFCLNKKNRHYQLHGALY